jgi:conjugal transfer mating pair stabilization protein TraG
MFTIICIGRSDFLIAVLNGIAMLTNDRGPAGYGGIVALGLLIGVLLALGRGIVTQRLEVQYVFVGWLLFSVMFVPKVTVTVEDIHTGDTTTVANIPLGPAAIGSVTSTVGITLADAFGTVFSYPSMTKSGYMDSLQVIDAMRDMDYGPANGSGGSGAAIPDMQRSVRAYLMDCVFYDMAMGLPTSLTWEKLALSADLLTDIRVDSKTWFTTLYLDGSPGGQALTCHDAYEALADYMRNHFLPAWSTYIAAKLNVPDAGVAIQGALDSLFGIGRNAQSYMLNTLFKREIELAELGYHAQANDAAGVVMRVQAMEQRRTQWASEQSMWQEMARPAIAYIEGFFYAVSPFMAFLVCLGAVGIAIFGRYLILAVWIQLWMPVLAVTNLYISIAASNELKQIVAGGSDPLSITGLDSVWTTTASWLALGGSMVAATPLLALILITGSYFAFTSLTNRLSGGDHVGEKVASPDLLAPASLASGGPTGLQSPRFVDDPSYGMHLQGAEQVAPSIELSSSLNTAQQSRTTQTAEATGRMLQEAFRGTDLSRKENLEAFLTNTVNQSSRSAATETDRVLHDMARSVVNDDQRFNQLSVSERNALSAAVALGMMEGGSGGQINQFLQSIQAKDAGERQTWANRISELTKHDSGKAVELARAIVHDDQQGSRSQFLKALGTDQGERWSQAVTATASALHGFEEVASLNQISGLRQNVSSLAYGRIAEVTHTTGDLVGLVLENTDKARHVTMEDVDELAGVFLKRGWSASHDHAYGAAAAIVLQRGTADSAVALAKYAAKHLGAQSGELGDPLANRDSTRSLIEEMVHEPAHGDMPSPRAITQAVEGHLREAGRPESLPVQERGEAAVHQFFEARLKKNRAEADAALAELDRVAAIEKSQDVQRHWQDTRSLLRYLNEANVSELSTSQLSARVGRGLGAAAARMHETYEEVYAQTGSRSTALTASLSAGASGLVEGWKNVRDDKYQEAYGEGRAKGLPDTAAQYYAYERASIYASPGEIVEHSLGKDAAHSKLRARAVAELGPTGGDIAAQALERAATSVDAARERYIDDALAIYRGNHFTPSPAGMPAAGER